MIQHGSIPGALVGALRDARHVCVLTGAGVSAESGVPTFREAAQGLWSRYDPASLATPEAFRADPALVWRWYRWRRELVLRVQPNSGHRAIAELARRLPRLTLVTQNVDGLHQRAGSDAVIEFHGNLFAEHCFDCRAPGLAGDGDEIPACAACGGHLRPGVVWFGEGIPETALETSSKAAANCDVFLSIGTSSQVFPAAGLADLAAGSGAKIAEINPEPTPAASGFDFAIAGKSGVVMPKLLELLAR